MNELLTMLNPKTASLSDVRGSFGAFSARDIMHALGGLAKGPHEMGSVILNDAPPKELMLELYSAAKGKIGLRPYLNILCAIAIAEVSGIICEDCQGRSFTFAQAGDSEALRSPDGLLVKPCKTCNESGRNHRMTLDEKAEAIAEAIDKPVTPRQYTSKYAWEADQVYCIAAGWLNTCSEHLANKLLKPVDDPQKI